MNELEQYKSTLNKTKNDSINQKRIDFIEDYPVESIPDLTMEEYMFAKEGYGNPNSFCRRISYGLNDLASVGNMVPDIFGIYLKGGTTITLSKTFEKFYGGNFDSAFKKIKELIFNLLNSFAEGDYDYYQTCELHQSFKQRLLIVYYGDVLIPVTAENTINGYCDALGLVYSKEDKYLDKNFLLFNCKKSDPDLSKMSNIDFMGFCDWLWRENRKYLVNSENINRLQKRDKKKTIIEYIEQNKDKFGFTEDKQYKKEIELIQDSENDLLDVKQLDKTEKETLIKNRIGQGWFRDQLIKKHKNCMLCGVSNKKILRASHIKDWSISSNEERLDINNGLLLCAQHDALFDKDLISFDENGHIQISSQLSNEDKIILGLNDNISIALNEKMKYYMKQHNSEILKNNSIVKHDSLGVGEILRENDETLEIDFIEGGVKNISKKVFNEGKMKRVF